MTHDEMIAVLEAHKRGEQIEWAEIGEENWRPRHTPNWNFSAFKYRVAKPESRRIQLFAYIHKDTGKITFAETLSSNPSFYRAPWLDGEVEE